MMENLQENHETVQNVAPTTPDDRGIVHIDGYIKIFDPNTDEILVEARE